MATWEYGTIAVSDEVIMTDQILSYLTILFQLHKLQTTESNSKMNSKQVRAWKEAVMT
jgi:hypothetical protein